MKQTVNYQPWDKYEQDLEIFTSRFLENQLKPMCHEKIMDLSVSFAYSDEPIPFEEYGHLKTVDVAQLVKDRIQKCIDENIG